MAPTIGIYLGAVAESTQNIEKQLVAWSSLIDRYDLELFGSARPPDTVVDRYRHVRTKERHPQNALIKQATTYRDVAEYVDRSDPDVLVQIWNFPGHALGVSLAGQRQNIPVVIRFSGDHFRESSYFSGPERLFYYAYLNLVGRLPLRLSDAIIALGPHGAAQLRSNGANDENVYVIPPATGIENRFYPPNDPSNHRQKLDISEEKTVLLYVGRITDLKGMEFLLEVISELADTEDYLFLLVGDGEYRDIFNERFDSDTVRTTGHISYSLIDRYYKSADAYIHCSPYEGIPAVILEALQCGLPVVSRKAGDIEFVTPNVVDTPGEMATMIRNQAWAVEWRNRDRFTTEYQRSALIEVFNELL